MLPESMRSRSMSTTGETVDRANPVESGERSTTVRMGMIEAEGETETEPAEIEVTKRSAGSERRRESARTAGVAAREVAPGTEPVVDVRSAIGAAAQVVEERGWTEHEVSDASGVSVRTEVAGVSEAARIGAASAAKSAVTTGESTTMTAAGAETAAVIITKSAVMTGESTTMTTAGAETAEVIITKGAVMTGGSITMTTGTESITTMSPDTTMGATSMRSCDTSTRSAGAATRSSDTAVRR